MTQAIAYLGFDGTCAEAMRFYEKALRGKLELMMSGADSRAALERQEDRGQHGLGERVLHRVLEQRAGDADRDRREDDHPGELMVDGLDPPVRRRGQRRPPFQFQWHGCRRQRPRKSRLRLWPGQRSAAGRRKGV